MDPQDRNEDQSVARAVVRPYVIVAGVQFDETGDAAWAEVQRIASRGRPNVEVHLCHVVSPALDEPCQGLPAQHERVDDCMDRLQVFALGMVGPSEPMSGHVNLHIAVGDVASELIQLAVDMNADAIVIGARDVSAKPRMSSVAQQLLAQSPCSVLVMRPKHYEGMISSRGFVERDPFPPREQRVYRRLSLPPSGSSVRSRALAV